MRILDLRGVEKLLFELVDENNEFEFAIEFGVLWCLGDFEGKTTFSVFVPTVAQNAEDFIIKDWISSLVSIICWFILSQISLNSFSFDSFSSINDVKSALTLSAMVELLCNSDNATDYSLNNLSEEKKTLIFTKNSKIQWYIE